MYHTDYTDLEAEIPPPEGMSYLPRNEQIKLLQVRAGQDPLPDGKAAYRITFATQADDKKCDAGACSKATFEMKITGQETNTGWFTLVTHPGMKCAAKTPAGCMTAINGKKMQEDASCPCDVSDTDYQERAAMWKPFVGITQSTTVQMDDVAEITEVRVRVNQAATSAYSDKAVSDSWIPVYFKISTIDPQTGYGSGIYYMDVGQPIGQNEQKQTFLRKADRNQFKMENKGSHKKGIIKCELATCEKEMDEKFMVEKELAM